MPLSVRRNSQLDLIRRYARTLREPEEATGPRRTLAVRHRAARDAARALASDARDALRHDRRPPATPAA